MAKNSYQNKQVGVQKEIFTPSQLGAVFMGSPRDFVLRKYQDNFVSNVNLNDVLAYFNDNDINWWKGNMPTGHTLSSQIACINHLFPIRKNKEAVLAIAQKIDVEIDGVLLLENDKKHQRGFISFEVVTDKDHLNEKKGKNKALTRGSQCTSIDHVILARKKGKNVILVIEWKYVEHYGNTDKSKNPKGKKSGDTRVNNYAGDKDVSNPNLIQNSHQLKMIEPFNIYFHEPFYQLMRQTLWAEQLIKFKESETIKADDFIHVHVIPNQNAELKGTYKCSGRDLESTWKSCLNNPEKYIVISPDELLSNLPKEYTDKLAIRYWR